MGHSHASARPQHIYYCNGVFPTSGRSSDRFRPTAVAMHGRTNHGLSVLPHGRRARIAIGSGLRFAARRMPHDLTRAPIQRERPSSMPGQITDLARDSSVDARPRACWLAPGPAVDVCRPASRAGRGIEVEDRGPEDRVRDEEDWPAQHPRPGSHERVLGPWLRLTRVPLRPPSPQRCCSNARTVGGSARALPRVAGFGGRRGALACLRLLILLLRRLPACPTLFTLPRRAGTALLFLLFLEERWPIASCHFVLLSGAGCGGGPVASSVPVLNAA